MSPARRRLFFALWPDDPVRQALFHWQTRNLTADVRWQHRADLHITLHFLGMVDAARIDALRGLGDAVVAERFTLVLDTIGHWPGPRVLWAAPSSVPDDLRDLHRRLGDGLAGLGMPPETRAYRPHVTLARKVRDALEAPSMRPLTWTVCEFALVESRPGDAPRYQLLARWPLAAG